MKHLLATIMLLAGLASMAAAEGIVLTNEVMIEVVTLNEEGEEVITYLPAQKATPGDVVMYQISYMNNGDETAEGIVLSSQIPAALLIIEGSAESEIAAVQYSIDGGLTFADRDALVVVGDDGQERPAQADDLTNIRWTVSSALPSGDSGMVTYRATVK